MPDISMCNGARCHMKENCYRFTAKPSDYQSYFMVAPIKDDQTCDHYWDNEGYDKKKKKK